MTEDQVRLSLMATLCFIHALPNKNKLTGFASITQLDYFVSFAKLQLSKKH